MNVKMSLEAENSNPSKKSGNRPSDHDSSSSQSSEQSLQELSGAGSDDLHRPCHSARPGKDGAGNPTECPSNPGLSLGFAETILSPPKFDYGQSVACVPFPYEDPYFGAAMASYGPQAIMHPQMAAGLVPPGRIPIPHEQAAEEPIYVNAKQYHGILRRRQLRAKLEAQNKIVKSRKPYLHESRHLHALKRARGSGGRFLNTKKGEQQDRQPDDAGSGRMDALGHGSLGALEEVAGAAFPAATSSGASNGNGPQHFGHSGFSAYGSRNRVPVMR